MFTIEKRYGRTTRIIRRNLENAVIRADYAIGNINDIQTILDQVVGGLDRCRETAYAIRTLAGERSSCHKNKIVCSTSMDCRSRKIESRRFH